MRATGASARSRVHTSCGYPSRARSARGRRGRADRRIRRSSAVIALAPAAEPRRRSPMMLRWISLVPPMIELARVASRPRTHRPSSTRRRRRARAARRARARAVAVSYEPLARLGPEQLHEARLRADLLAAREPVERARVVQPEDLDVDPRLREPLAHARGSSCDPRARQACDQELDRRLVEHLLLPDERRAALVGERRVRDPPAFVLGTDRGSRPGPRRRRGTPR